jgi:RHS repeat-associated protein
MKQNIQRVFSLLLLSTGLMMFSFKSSAQTNIVPDNIEFAVLKNIYDSLGGSSWKTKTNWPTSWPASATSAQFGTWYGVTVTNGDITKISLINNGLSGVLPKTISKLTKLKQLYLNNNTNISGSIPSSYGSLSSLLDIDLSTNALSGSIPTTFGSLTALTRLKLNNNALTGSIPTQLANLAALTELYVHVNQLTGSIPSGLGNLTNLQYLYIGNNTITGSLPSSLGNLVNLKYFFAGTTSLSGSIPGSFANLTEMLSFDVSKNSHTGAFPDVGAWTKVTQIRVGGNSLSGTIPSTIANCTALTTLSFEDNGITAIPTQVLNLPVLVYLNATNNNVISIPDLASHVNKTNLTLLVSNNKLDFAQLETLYNKGIKSVTLTPQKSLDDVTYVRVTAGGILVIPARNAGANGSITWQRRLDTGSSFTDVTSINEDTSQKTFKKSNLQDTDDGRFIYKMTNTLFPGVTIQSINIVVRIGRDVVWNRKTNVTEVNGLLQKTNADGWDAGGGSENILASNTDGFIEFGTTPSTSSNSFAVGFSVEDTNYDLAHLEYGIELKNSGGLRIIVHESSATGIDIGTWVAGDYFKISREGSSIKYYRNGGVIRTVSITSNQTYQVKSLVNHGTSPDVSTSFWIPASHGDVPDTWEIAFLRELYDSFNGAGWFPQYGWPADESEWNGKYSLADFTDALYGITVVNADIERIEFFGPDKTGSIPNSIKKLTGLKKFILSEVLLTSFLPDLSSLIKLEELTVTTDIQNESSSVLAPSSIPSWIGNLKALKKLVLVRLKLNGALPTELGSLTNLTSLDLNSNNLSGSLPASFSALTSLAVLNLGNNSFQGQFPSVIGSLTALTNLQLYKNHFSTWPASFNALSNLKALNVSSNNFSGVIPSWMGSFMNLTSLTLSDNALTSLPASITNLSNLKSLDISHNQFSGPLMSFAGMTLTALDISNNAFTDLSGISTLTTVTALFASANQLSGFPNFGNNPIVILHLNDNPTINSEIPESARAVLGSAQEIIFSNANLKGQLPEWLNEGQVLFVADFSHNSLTGKIPQLLFFAYNYCDLSFNQLSGPLPSWIFEVEISRVLLSHNQFTGSIPPINYSPYLGYVDLSHNKLSGELQIADEDSLPYIEYFNVSNNALTGAIPQTISDWNSCSNYYCPDLLFDFSNNKFTSAPSEIWSSSLKAVIKLDHNLLTEIGIPNGAPTTEQITLNDNLLDFNILDYLPHGTTYNSRFTYFPQQEFAPETPRVPVAENGSLSITGRLLGPTSTMIWERSSDGNTWEDISYLNEDGTGENFYLSTFSLSDQGVYRWRQVDSTHPNGEIRSSSIEVQLTDAVNESPIDKLYNGLITSVRWHTKKAFEIDGEDFSGMYAFSYDDRYQIQEARWSDDVNNTLGTFSFAGNKFRLNGMNYDPNGNIETLKRYDKDGWRIHNFEYQYQGKYSNNKLTSIPEYVNTFTYDAIGQMIGEDKVENGSDLYVDYDASGRVVAVYSNSSKTNLKQRNIYDDRGFRLTLVDYVNNRTTWYIRDAAGGIISIHEQEGTINGEAPAAGNLVLTEIPILGSGKLGTYYPQQQGSVNYEITDHLGNVRAILRDNNVEYVATMEDNGIEDNANPFRNPRVEQMQYFENLFETEQTDAFMNVSKPIPGVIDNPDKVAYLYWDDNTGTQASNKAIGPAIALQVYGGTKVNIETYTRFENKTSFAKDFDLAALSALLGNSFVSQGGFEGFSTSQVTTSLNDALSAALYPDDEDDDQRPYAYLNYIIYDQNMVSQTAGWLRVPEEAGSDQSALYLSTNKPIRLAFDPVTINQDGYIYVWVSNQSKQAKVWFDDLKVALQGSFVTQATDYGVWGDVIREQKSDESIYRYGYQGQFSERDLATGWNHFELREYDPIIGRWLVPDPYHQNSSPYAAMGNKPINALDPDGGWFITQMFQAAQKFASNINAVFKDFFGVNNAVTIQSVDIEVEKTGSWWDRILGREPEVVCETYYQLVPNGEWDVSSLSKNDQFIVNSFRDLLEAPTAIEAFVLPPDFKVKVFKLGDIFGYTANPKQIYIPSNLPNYNKAYTRFNVASQVLHELLWHVSPAGKTLYENGKTSNYLYNRIGGIEGNSHGPGKDQNRKIPTRAFPK